MSAIASADVICIQLLVIIYIAIINAKYFCTLNSDEKCTFCWRLIDILYCFAGLDKPSACFMTIYYKIKTIITFFANFAAAISTW